VKKIATCLTESGFLPIGREIGRGMNIYSNSEVPISEADRSEIVALYIALMRERDAAADAGGKNTESENKGRESPALPFLDPPDSPKDLRSQWGL